ncbi:hypothetical protein [Thiocystis violacea]|uniref:hypothetical protein n=1 Tax=Thiocystis violacea TaxID=13725 RepID=UPI0019088626|nr:hypothetical protein [Thiocystis violacea]MBK1722667.1 hypothetical protein [Thiocystis violacea]
MASSEKTSSRSGIGFLPKLILWSVVIAFGYLYLSSIDREGGGQTTASSLISSISKLSPVPISALPGMSKGEETPAVEAEVAQADATPSEKASDHKPVSDAESAVFAKSLMKPEAATVEPAAEKAVEAVAATGKPEPEPMAPRRQVEIAPPASYSALAAKPQAATPEVKAREPVVEAAPVPAQSQQAAPAPAAQVAAMPAPVAPVPEAPAGVAMAPASPAPGDWSAMQQQRDQMLAEYEAMRREADQRMRQYWERMRSAAPAMPYGYPGYAPGYAPGVYAPPR